MGSGGHNQIKNNVNQFRHIDLRLIQQEKCLKQPCNSFVYPWGDGVILCNYDGHSLSMLYSLNRGSVIVEIGKTRTNYGYRSWFICPGCDKRVTKIYYRWNQFRCRTCQMLNYASSQQTHNRLEAVYQRIYKIQNRLGVEHDPLNTDNIEKPARMHNMTYKRSMDRLAELDEQSRGAFLSECERRMKLKL